MRTVWKFQLPVRDVLELTGPKPLEIVHVGPDGPADLLVWAEVDPARPPITRHLRVVGTGNPVPPEVTRHIGSVMAPPFVWHVYEADGGE